MGGLLYERMIEQARRSGAEIGALQAERRALHLRITSLTRALSKIAGAPIDEGANEDAERLQRIARIELEATPLEFGGFRQTGDVLEAAE